MNRRRGDREQSVHVLFVGDTASAGIEALAAEDEFSVTAEPTAESGRTRFDASDFDCVVCDNSLPDGTGIDFLRTLRAVHPEFPFVLLVDAATEDVVEAAYDADVTGLVSRQDGNWMRLLPNRVRSAVDCHLARTQATRNTQIIAEVRRLLQSVTDADTRAEIVRVACERFASSDSYASAWYGDAAGETLTSIVRAGSGDSLPDVEAIPVRGPVRDVIDSGQLQVVSSDDVPGLESLTPEGRPTDVAVVPVTHRDSVYGVCFVTADRPDAFTRVERGILDGLGDTIGFAIHAVEAMAQLRANRNRLQAVLSTSPDYIFIFDTEGNYEEILTGAERITIRPPSEFIGQSVYDILPEETADEVYDAIQNTLHTGDVQRVEYRLVFEDGRVAWYEGRAVPLVYPGEEREHVLFVARDVTERRERERQLRVVDRVLRHNLRNGLAVIMGYADDIEQRFGDDVADDVDAITRKGEQLLDTADKEREVVELLVEKPARERFDAVPILEQVVRGIRERWPGACIDLRTPATATVFATVNFDDALRELIQNAVEHSDRETPHVWVSLERMDDSVRIQIADDGPGIPDEEIGVLTGGHEIAPLYHGSGLGLWLVHWIVKRSAGALAFEKREPRGSVVSIELPRVYGD